MIVIKTFSNNRYYLDSFSKEKDKENATTLSYKITCASTSRFPHSRMSIKSAHEAASPDASVELGLIADVMRRLAAARASLGRAQ